jgi:hypothetical protein
VSALSLAEFAARRVIGALVEGGMLSDEQRKAAEEKAVAALLARDLPPDLGAEWRRLHK